MPSSHISSHMKWRFPPGSSDEPNRRRRDVCERHSSLRVFMGVHTHVSEVEEGRFSQIVFQFLHHHPSLSLSRSLPPSFTLPHHFLSYHHLHSWLRLSHPFISLLPSSLSLSEVNAGSLQCSECVQHQDYVSEYWLTAGDLTNGEGEKKKEGDSSYGSPPRLTELNPLRLSLWVHVCAGVCSLLTHSTCRDRAKR